MNSVRKSIQAITLLVALLFSGSVVFAQSVWKADPAHSKVNFSTVHNTISDVAGLFTSFEANVTSSKADFSDAMFDLKINTESIDTEIKMRDDHLRSADFFDVEKYPTITFKSEGIEKANAANKYKINGTLTMHGISKPVTMDIWYRGTISDKQSGNTISGFQVTGFINRSDFNIGTKFPNAMISDKVMIKADGEFIKQK